jgi:hypothetical protein
VVSFGFFIILVRINVFIFLFFSSLIKIKKSFRENGSI